MSENKIPLTQALAMHQEENSGPDTSPQHQGAGADADDAVDADDELSDVEKIVADYEPHEWREVLEISYNIRDNKPLSEEALDRANTYAAAAKELRKLNDIES